MNPKAGSFELLEPASPESLAPDPWLEPWMIVVAIVAVLVLALLLMFLNRRKKPHFDAKAAREAARFEALLLLDNIRNVTAREAAVQASLVLRKYLITISGDPALFETHEETIARHRALHAFTDEARAAAGTTFNQLAALKYAEQIPDEAADNVTRGARSLLETLHQGFRQ